MIRLITLYTLHWCITIFSKDIVKPVAAHIHFNITCLAKSKISCYCFWFQMPKPFISILNITFIYTLAIVGMLSCRNLTIMLFYSRCFLSALEIFHLNVALIEILLYHLEVWIQVSIFTLVGRRTNNIFVSASLWIHVYKHYWFLIWILISTLGSLRSLMLYIFLTK